MYGLGDWSPRRNRGENGRQPPGIVVRSQHGCLGSANKPDGKLERKKRKFEKSFLVNVFFSAKEIASNKTLLATCSRKKKRKNWTDTYMVGVSEYDDNYKRKKPKVGSTCWSSLMENEHEVKSLGTRCFLFWFFVFVVANRGAQWINHNRWTTRSIVEWPTR